MRAGIGVRTRRRAGRIWRIRRLRPGSRRIGPIVAGVDLRGHDDRRVLFRLGLAGRDDRGDDVPGFRVPPGSGKTVIPRAVVGGIVYVAVVHGGIVVFVVHGRILRRGRGSSRFPVAGRAVRPPGVARIGRTHSPDRHARPEAEREPEKQNYMMTTHKTFPFCPTRIVTRLPAARGKELRTNPSERLTHKRR